VLATSFGAIVLAATEAMLPSGHLQPGTSVDGRLSFTVPRQGQRLRLEFRDLDGARVAVGLGNVDVAPPGAGQHAH